jgi:hypothetical protein
LWLNYVQRQAIPRLKIRNEMLSADEALCRFIIMLWSYFNFT